jgi:hypothetical protein
MMTPTTMSEESFVGFFEADGQAKVSIQVAKAKIKGYKLSTSLTFEMSQAQANIDVLENVKTLLGGGQIYLRKPRANTNEQPSARLSIKLQSTAGKKILSLFDKYPLRLKRVARDLEIIKAIVEIRAGDARGTNNRILTSRQKSLILLLAYQNSSQLNVKSTVNKKKPIIELKQKFDLTKEYFKNGWAEIKQKYLPKIKAAEKNTETLTKNTPFSKDYILGFFIGDGELGVSHHLQYEQGVPYPAFKFSITDPDKDFLLAIQDTLKCGTVTKEFNSAYQFRIQSKKDIANKIFPILSTGFLPSGKQKNFDKFKEAYELSLTKEIRTRAGWAKFVELTYDLNLSGSRRQHTKEELIALGEEKKV